jgi:hypothetical protein
VLTGGAEEEIRGKGGRRRATPPLRGAEGMRARREGWLNLAWGGGRGAFRVRRGPGGWTRFAVLACCCWGGEEPSTRSGWTRCVRGGSVQGACGWRARHDAIRSEGPRTPPACPDLNRHARHSTCRYSTSKSNIFLRLLKKKALTVATFFKKGIILNFSFCKKVAYSCPLLHHKRLQTGV